MERLIQLFGITAFFFALSAMAAVGSSTSSTPSRPDLEILASVQAQGFAAAGLSARITFDPSIRSETSLPSNSIPLREFHIYSFVETGELGDKSFDIDSSALRWKLGERGHFWFGRTQPLEEGRPSALGKISYLDAIGSRWGQNQSNALEPRVSGWLGFGAHFKQDSGFFQTISYSPIFLPSFGPAVSFSETEMTRGSRFAKLPPFYYQMPDGAILPMHYRIDTGSIWNIVRQDQVLLSVGYSAEEHGVALTYWSAPSPDPTAQTSGVVKTDNQNASVLVTAVPSFPEERFLALSYAGKGWLLKPRFQLVQEFQNHSTSVSLQISPTPFIDLGYLNTISRDPILDSETGIISAKFNRDLLWTELRTSLAGGKLLPSLKMEYQYTSGLEGMWIRPMVNYRSDEHMTFYAGASVITGQDYSYFGTWKALDSVYMGARYQW